MISQNLHCSTMLNCCHFKMNDWNVWFINLLYWWLQILIYLLYAVWNLFFCLTLYAVDDVKYFRDLDVLNLEPISGSWKWYISSWELSWENFLNFFSNRCHASELYGGFSFPFWRHALLICAYLILTCLHGGTILIILLLFNWTFHHLLLPCLLSVCMIHSNYIISYCYSKACCTWLLFRK